MRMYERIRNLVCDRNLPVGGVTASGEYIIIEQGQDEAGAFYRITTLQDNEWLRINTLYANGDSIETYRR